MPNGPSALPITVSASTFVKWLFAIGLSSFAALSAADVTFQDCSDCPDMTVVPAGQFLMGSEQSAFVIGKNRPEGPVHKVAIRRPFAAGTTEVTNKQFAAFVDATGYAPSKHCSKWKGSVTKFGGDWTDPDYGRPPKPDEPVVCVSWHDAKAYVAWLKETTGKPYRLLSEAEWEYAARAESATVWPWGTSENDVCKHANVFDRDGTKSDYAKEYALWDPVDCNDDIPRVASVASLAPNKFGLYDMIGNVWEWTEDCSLEFYSDDASDETPVQVDGVCDKRAVRGGSWLTRIDRQRPTFRGRDPEALASHIFGFRIARDVIPTDE
jgi:formylglycine-generating enzyme required for sulfatase activity